MLPLIRAHTEAPAVRLDAALGRTVGHYAHTFRPKVCHLGEDFRMPNLTPGQIIDFLARGEENRLIGAEESEQVDFKLAPYLLETPQQKWELAKDIAAFANKRGGVIVVGVQGDRRPNEIIEVASAIRPVRKAIVDLQQYRGVVDGWIYPRPLGVDFRWYPPSIAADSGLLIVDVPAQDEALAPFIVRDMRDPEGEFKGAVGIR